MTLSFRYEVRAARRKLVGHIALDRDLSDQAGRVLRFPIIDDGVVRRQVRLTVCPASRRSSSCAALRVRDADVAALHSVTEFMPGTIVVVLPKEAKGLKEARATAPKARRPR